MLWYVELLIQSALVLRLHLWPDGRRYFEALLAVDLSVQILQRMADAQHMFGVSVPVWYLGQILNFPLLALSLIECSKWQFRFHRCVLCWWAAANMTCAWVRIFPYTGRAILLINSFAFVIWIIGSLRYRVKSDHD